jgi:hypothetical protein
LNGDPFAAIPTSVLPFIAVMNASPPRSGSEFAAVPASVAVAMKAAKHALKGILSLRND